MIEHEIMHKVTGQRDIIYSHGYDFEKIMEQYGYNVEDYIVLYSYSTDED